MIISQMEVIFAGGVNVSTCTMTPRQNSFQSKSNTTGFYCVFSDELGELVIRSFDLNVNS